jgi:diguanylate cyclase (GGDEF)-like protein
VGAIALGAFDWYVSGGPAAAMHWPLAIPLVLGGAALTSGLAVAWRLRARAAHTARDQALGERIDAVLAIADRLARAVDREEIFRTIVTDMNRVLRADATTIRLLRDDRLEPVAWAGIADDAAARLPVLGRDEGWFGEMLRTGRPWVCDDTRAPDRAWVYERYAGSVEFGSDIAVPLVHHDRVIGSLSSVCARRRHWTEADVEFATALATHASIALQNAELVERTEGRAAQLAVLQAASARMSRENSVESIGRAVVEETRRIIDYHNARVYLIEPPEDVVPIAFEGRVGEYEKVDFALLRTKIGRGFTGYVAQHGGALLVNDANADPRGATIPGTDDVDESMLVVPMRYDERTIGVITLSKLGINQFDDEDLRLLTILADQAATALESARLLARGQALALELRQLVDMGSALSASLDPVQVADLIAMHMATSLGLAQCAISYWDRTGDRVLTTGYFPPEGRRALEPYYSLADYPATRRVLTEGLITFVDVDDPAADPAEVALLRRDGFRGLAMLPLVAKGQPIGLVELISRDPLRLDASRLEFARTMANEAAMALENAKLYENARDLADHDPLTGFLNHRAFHERLGEEIVRAGRSRQPLSLLMIDLDGFKLVNDTFGHQFGDRVLTWTAELIRSTLRASDIPARYGGDEFAVILPETDGEAARHAAVRILAAFRDHAFQAETRGPVPIGVSIGTATHPLDARTAAELIAAADAALYGVKGSGGGTAHRAADGRAGATAKSA